MRGIWGKETEREKRKTERGQNELGKETDVERRERERKS